MGSCGPSGYENMSHWLHHCEIAQKCRIIQRHSCLSFTLTEMTKINFRLQELPNTKLSVTECGIAMNELFIEIKDGITKFSICYKKLS